MDNQKPEVKVLCEQVYDRKFATVIVDVPVTDCDVRLRFPGGKEELVVQCRPSNADVGYNGSLDVYLTTPQRVASYRDGELTPTVPAHPLRQHERVTQQLVMELPGEYPE